MTSLALRVLLLSNAVGRHGFYPSYYLFFLSAVLINVFDTGMQRFVYPMTTKAGGVLPTPVYSFVSGLLTFSLMNYFGAAFTILHVGDVVETWRSVYFCGHIFGICIAVLLAAVPPKRPTGKQHVQ